MNKKKQERKERNKKDKIWKERIHSRSKQCEKCGRKTNLNAHHLLPKELYPEYRHCEWNGICLCARCHRWGKGSAHQDPIGFISFLMVRDKRQVDFLIEMAKLSHLKALKCLTSDSNSGVKC